MTAASAARAVTFDFGQVLASFDAAYLAEKLARRGIASNAAAFGGALANAWRCYGECLHQGGSGEQAWKTLLRVILQAGDVAPQGELLDDLFREQTRDNLWRCPVPGMIELAKELRREGVPVGIVSNSEGGLEGLIQSLGWNGMFAVVADSGVLGLEKPHAPIFHWTAERLGVRAAEMVHIGDSWVADVEGARNVGARAIWFLSGVAETDLAPSPLPDGVRFAGDASAARAALHEWAVLR